MHPKRMTGNFTGIVLVALLAAALMQLCVAHLELKYNYEAVAWVAKNDHEQLKAIVTAGFQRMHRDAQRIADLEARLTALTAQKAQSN